MQWDGGLECTCFEFISVKVNTLISYMIFNFFIAIIFGYLIPTIPNLFSIIDKSKMKFHCVLIKLKFYAGTISC